jgi:hypothetical protein
MKFVSRRSPWLLVVIIGLVCGMQAQIFGPRASITSLGDGYTLHNPPGIRASVTSLGPQGFTPRPFFSRGRVATAVNHPFFRDHHRHFNGGVALPVYAVPYYYADYPVVVDPTDTSMEENYGPGPTIFDRRGSDASSAEIERQYDERLTRLEKQLDEAEARESAPSSASTVSSARAEIPEAPAVAQPSTMLAFRDGHTAEVKNYAIVGDTLYDFSTQSRHKIALTELDLAATQKQNEDRGVDFHVPAGSAN